VAAKSMRILESVSWDDDQRIEFLKHDKLPTPEYPVIDVSLARELIHKARQSIDGDHFVFEWLGRLANTLETTTHLISSRGTPDFFQASSDLFGEPTKLMLDVTAEEFVAELAPRLTHHFGDQAPSVEISETLSAKAAAGRTRIRIRASAEFTERDIEQLLQHEALIHTATALNGRAQPHFKILGRAHAGTTEVQEGLAVFAEIISGAMDPHRFRRLSDRVIAIQMSIDGADFKEVFDFYQERVDDPDQAYENTRRVFRGGMISGGAPFTKDMVYLNGLLRVHNFMRTVVKLGRADLIRILFCGKMDIEDVPALAQMASKGRMRAPEFMPPWAKDLRFLVSYMAYSEELDGVPVVWDFAR